MLLIRKIGFLSALILPLLVIVGEYFGGWWNYSSLAFVFVAIPVFDYFIGLDKENVPEENKPKMAEELYYKAITYLWVLVQYSFLLWAVNVIANGELKSTVEIIAFTIGTSLITGGIGITVAHELGHKKSNVEQFLSKLLLMTTCYMHFFH
jgi:alkane 1-monooxygenase